jgi:hypothetical protein
MMRSGNYLDLAIMDIRIKIDTNDRQEVKTHHYDSDHKAIEILVRGIGEFEKDSIEIGDDDNSDGQHQQQIRYNFNKINWQNWTEDLDKAHHSAIMATN